MTDKIEDRLQALLWFDGEVTTAKLIEYGQAMATALSALRTQRDEVIEECARVAERYGVPVGAGDGSTYISSASPIEIATAIRNLKSQDEPR